MDKAVSLGGNASLDFFIAVAAYPEFYNLVKQLEHEGGGMRDPNAKPPPPGCYLSSICTFVPLHYILDLCAVRCQSTTLPF